MPTVGNLILGLIIGVIYLLLLVGGTGALVIAAGRLLEAGRVAWHGPSGATDADEGGWSMMQGTVRRSNGVVSAPLSGREVVCAALRIEKHKKRGGSIPTWGTEEETTVGERFAVGDGTRTTHVDPTGAEVRVDDSRIVRRNHAGGDGFDEFAIAFEDSEELPTGENTRYAEAPVQPGDEVLVYGPVLDADGGPTLGGDGGATITTRSPGIQVMYLLLSAGKFAALGLVLLAIPGVFIVFFLVPRLLGA